MAVRFKLRLLSGELKGRELTLPEGEFTLGEQDCDVLLPLSQGKIVTLVISEHQIMMRVSGEVWVNGSQHDLQHALPLRQAIETSGLVLALGEENDSLSDVKMTPRTGSQVLLWLSMVTLMLLSLIFILIFWVMQQPKVLLAYLPPDLPTQLSEQLNKPALQGVKAGWLSDGSVMLSGHCTSSSAVINLQNFLALNHIVFRNQLVCDDHLITNVSDVLHQYGYQDTDIHAGKEPGVIIIHGAIEMGGQWSKAQEALASIAGLKSWKVVNTHDGQISQLIERLRELGLLGYLSMVQNNKEVTISGVLAPDQRRKLTEMLAILAQQQPELLAVRYQNIPISDQAAKLLPAAIVSYGGNRNSGFVQLANGLRLQQGSVLANGYKVIFIGEQGISLLKTNNLIHIPMSF
ncbi:type III secretion system inner membrane ring subunit SctD [Yersinia aleksiciae]|uniref:type III secretion system inner membrane ring subunit SctD n=1 Tax=Yersinia aleksiciae TaxID=263819 RepID=UPI001427C684|nr:type III secretion system inner membrane ring subunit SctD [Yersinia aleksiciae]MDA5498199.1 type III secretion system inner membrane ring subunit SctD [Yersinia aleksiciae]NIL00383.1 type III secretion system inner membrane ring subunit SctD [Yersinia aleksiciae]WQC70449.1 type III secretion system inner membrane ring subunit SctD [Yersinia aleksiciae]